MNTRKFLGLLNQYLDGEIDPGAAAELEREILSNPERRRVYTDYCRIHRATKLVYEQFRTLAAEQSDAGVRTLRGAVQTSSAGMSLPSSRRRFHLSSHLFRPAAGWAAGLAAACAALAAGLFIAHAPEKQAAAPSRTEVVASPAAEATTDVAPSAVARFPAPFAGETKMDPYIVEPVRSRTDPFALTQSQGIRPVVDEGVPASFKSLSIGPVTPASLKLDKPLEEPKDRANTRVFRSRQHVEDVQFEPAGSEIHR